MEYFKKTTRAFFFGGVAAVITEFFYRFFAFLPVNPYERSLLVLGIVALIGTILFLLGIYPKLEKQFGFGAMLPIAGLPPAIASGIAVMRREKAPLAQIIKKGILPVIYVLVFGIIFAMIYAVAVTVLS